MIVGTRVRKETVETKAEAKEHLAETATEKEKEADHAPFTDVVLRPDQL